MDLATSSMQRSVNLNRDQGFYDSDLSRVKSDQLRVTELPEIQRMTSGGASEER